jgi:hypothetical protein
MMMNRVEKQSWLESEQIEFIESVRNQLFPPMAIANLDLSLSPVRARM